MATLSIRLLGGFEMERDGGILSPPATPKSRSLLAYMLLNRGRLIHRETLCATLWPDDSEAVARILAEHAELRMLAVGPCELEPAMRLCRFADLLKAHVRYEERTFFPQLQLHAAFPRASNDAD